MDRWQLLWESLDDTVRIELTESVDHILVHYSDGSVGVLDWYEGEWRCSGSFNACPGDVAARDTF